MKPVVKVINKSKNPLPEYETASSAGVDLRAEYGANLQPGERVLVKTGLYFEIPQGYEGQMRPRSGLALKHGISLVNTPGTIDSDYRGEIGVILINHGQNSFKFDRGERIAQMVFAPVQQVEFEEVEDLSETDRGTGGYGSTGTA